ncbi:MAG: DMT family transporter [Bdellovibrionales bacterium]
MKFFSSLLRRRSALRGAQVSALAYCLLGYAIWACADAIAKLVSSADAPKYQLLAIVAFGGIVSVGMAILAQGKIKLMRPRNPAGLIALSLFSVCTGVGIVVALSHIPFVQYYVIGFMSPMVIALLAAIFMGERLDGPKIFAIVVGFIGVVVAVNPYELLKGHGNLIGIFATVCVVMSFSVQMLLLRVLGRKDSRESLALWPRISSLFIYLAFGVFAGFSPMAWPVVLLAFAWGFVGGFGWLAMAEASQRAPAAVLAPCQYSQILYGAAFGYFVWHETLSWYLALGSVIIMGAGVYMFRHACKLDAIAGAQA